MADKITIELFKKKDLNCFLDWFGDFKNRKYMNTKHINAVEAKKLISSDLNKKCYCIKLGNKPIGYCMLKDIKGNAKVGIMIDSKYTRRGYGQIAMKLLEKEAEKLKISKLALMVNCKNKGAISFYKKLNYANTFFIMEKKL